MCAFHWLIAFAALSKLYSISLLLLAIEFGIFSCDHVCYLVKANGYVIALATKSCMFMFTLFFKVQITDITRSELRTMINTSVVILLTVIAVFGFEIVFTILNSFFFISSAQIFSSPICWGSTILKILSKPADPSAAVLSRPHNDLCWEASRPLRIRSNVARLRGTTFSSSQKIRYWSTYHSWANNCSNHIWHGYFVAIVQLQFSGSKCKILVKVWSIYKTNKMVHKLCSQSNKMKWRLLNGEPWSKLTSISSSSLYLPSS